MASKFSELLDSAYELAKQGISLSTVARDVEDYIDIATELFNIQFYRVANFPPKLDVLEIAGPISMITVIATDGQRVLSTQNEILEVYARRKGLFRLDPNGMSSIASVQIGPYKYPIVRNHTVVSVQDTFLNKDTWTTPFTLKLPSKSVCSCDMVTLMNSGCKCGGL